MVKTVFNGFERHQNKVRYYNAGITKKPFRAFYANS
jgi:hypothetical protein